MGTIDSRQLERLTRTLDANGVDYLYIGKSAAIIHGFADTTQDADIYVRATGKNKERTAAALKELGFALTGEQEEAVKKGRDFIQLHNGPFDLDLIYAPDGIESFEQAWSRGLRIEGHKVCSIDDVIASKRAANRPKDRESLDRLERFRTYLRKEAPRGERLAPLNPTWRERIRAEMQANDAGPATAPTEPQAAPATGNRNRDRRKRAGPRAKRRTGPLAPGINRTGAAGKDRRPTRGSQRGAVRVRTRDFAATPESRDEQQAKQRGEGMRGGRNAARTVDWRGARAVRRPEEEPGETARVDFHATIGNEEYALEHTVIEAIEKEIENYETVVVPIRDHLKENLPDRLPGTVRYELQVPVDVVWQKGRVARKRALDSLTNWIQKTAHAMDDESQAQWELGRNPHRAYRQACEEPPELGFKVRLRRCPDAAAWGRPSGSLDITRCATEDLEKERRRRLHRAFSAKWPKLKEWGPRGARTVLVLENDNIALTNWELIAEEVVKVVTEFDEAPDDVFLVETHTDPWRVWVLKHEDAHCPNAGLDRGAFPESELKELEIRLGPKNATGTAA